MPDECILGIQRCGCITYANADPDHLDREDEKAIAKIVVSGGRIDRTTLEEARARPHFLTGDCPHDPKGWEREPPPKLPRIHRIRRTGRQAGVVDVYVKGWESGRFRAGEVGQRDGKWWATEGWMDEDAAGAHTGAHTYAADNEKIRADVLGPFAKRAEAAEALLPLAEKRAAARLAEWARKGATA